MTEDISKNTLLVLVVLTIVVSLLGTWTVINEAGRVHVDQPISEAGPMEDTATGKVSLTVTEPEEVSVTGQVILTIV